MSKIKRKRVWTPIIKPAMAHQSGHGAKETQLFAFLIYGLSKLQLQTIRNSHTADNSQQERSGMRVEFLRVEFLLKTESGYLRDAEVT